MAFTLPEWDVLKDVSKMPMPDPSKTRMRPIEQVDSALAATAQTFNVKIPTDKFIWCIMMSIGEDTTATGTQGTLADDLTDISLIGNGNKYMKVMTAPMSKEISKVCKDVQATGYYTLYLKDPKLGLTRPLPAWIFTSLILRLVDNAPAASNYHHIRFSLVESDFQGEDLSHWPVFIEKYLTRESWGASTGWRRFEHDRAYTVYGYLYLIDDNGTPSNTVVDKLKCEGKFPEGQDILLDEVYLPHLQEANKKAYQNQAMGTGYAMAEFPQGYDTRKYSNLRTLANVPSAGTDVGMTVLERYILA